MRRLPIHLTTPSPTFRHSGFTLIELMVTVGILGVIASIAFASYTSYIETARGGALTANFETAVQTARNNYVAARQLNAIGANATDVIPNTSAGWASMLNTAGSFAPDGGDAFEAGSGNETNGAVGVAFSGTYANYDSQVIVTRPAYAGLPETSVIIAQANY